MLTTLGMFQSFCAYIQYIGERLTDEEVDQLLSGHNDSHGNVNIADFVRTVMNT